MSNWKLKRLIMEESGAALTPVILLISLFILLVTSFSVYVTNSATSLSVTRMRITDIALTQSALEFGMGRVLSTPKTFPIYGEDRVRLKTGEARILWRAETARLDINLAEESFVVALLEIAGLKGSNASQLAHNIIDSRSGKAKNRSQQEPQGSDDPTRTRFAHIRELLDVQGMTSEIFSRLEPYVTVYGASSSIDPRLADEELLNRIPGISKPMVAELLALRDAKDERAKNVIASLGELARFFDITRKPTTRFVIETKTSPNTIRTYEVVTIHFDDDVRPYQVLSWRDMTDQSKQDVQ